MFKRDSSAHVRSYRLAVLGLRRDFLRELRGDYVTKSMQCSILQKWSDDWADLIYEAQGILGMAKANGTKPQTEWRGFKDFRLTADQLEAFAVFEVHDDDLMDLIQTVLTEGYKLTLTYSSQSDTYNCSMTCNAEKHPNQGYTMSAFAPSMYAAMRLLMFKHFVLLDTNWENIPAPQKGGMG